MNDLWYLALRARADILVPVGIVLAILVTLHVLLHKREVAAAVGWIGFAWFAPITGSVLYLLFGVNRVRRRALRLRRRTPRAARADAAGAPPLNPHFMALRKGIGRLTHRSVLAGNAVDIYQDGDAAYPAMLDAISAARHSIGLSSYIFRDDVWGRRFVAALSAAHGRGVAVRVLIDGIGGGWLLSRAWRRLRREHVIAARFLHAALPWRMPFLNLRNHRKILVLDGATAFTGGINIAAQNVQADRPSHAVRDTHFRLRGPVVAQLADAFGQDWAFATGENLDSDLWRTDPPSAGAVPARVIESGPDEDIEKVEFAILQAVACARHDIAIMTPYFLPDERLISALVLAAQRGVGVDIVLPAQSDHRLVQWATLANAAPLLSHGVRLWQCPPPFRHSKILVVDHLWCLIGSANWDIRSFRLNFELCVELYDEALAASLSDFMRQNRGAALTAASLRRLGLPARLLGLAARLLLPYL